MKTVRRFDDLPPYKPIEPFEVLSKKIGLPVNDIVKLDANENPYGPSPKVRAVMANLEYPHIYPDPESRALRTVLSDFTVIPYENILVGSGADELIDLILKVMLEPDDNVLICPPTFGMYSFDTMLNAGNVVEVPRLNDFSLDLEKIQQAVDQYKPKVIFATAPNNPDGRFPTSKEFEILLNLPCLIVIDEAYIEFADKSGNLGKDLTHMNKVLERENIIVLRTFSKWAGLAGLRVGYGVFPDWIMPVLWKVKQPYNVNVAASVAAMASIQDKDWLSANIIKIQMEREELYTSLKNIPYLTPFPSQANYILSKVKGLDAYSLKTDLANRGIFVRYYYNSLLRDYIRISIGTPEHSEKLISALMQIAAERNLL